MEYHEYTQTYTHMQCNPIHTTHHTGLAVACRRGLQHLTSLSWQTTSYTHTPLTDWLPHLPALHTLELHAPHMQGNLSQLLNALPRTLQHVSLVMVPRSFDERVLVGLAEHVCGRHLKTLGYGGGAGVDVVVCGMCARM